VLVFLFFLESRGIEEMRGYLNALSVVGRAWVGACAFSFLPPQGTNGYQSPRKLLRYISGFQHVS